MRVEHLHGTRTSSRHAPVVIDVTPEGVSAGTDWRAKARAVVAVLLALVILPLAWFMAATVLLVMLGLGVLAVIAIRVWLWHVARTATRANRSFEVGRHD